MKNVLIILFFSLSFSVLAQKQRGNASFYDQKFEGRSTASGEVFTQNGNTAAHKTLPFNSMVKVTNLKNGKSAIVRINDRGPFIRGRIIDLTTKTAKELDFLNEGTVEVEIELLSDTGLSTSVEASPSTEVTSTPTSTPVTKTKLTTPSVRKSLSTTKSDKKEEISNPKANQAVASNPTPEVATSTPSLASTYTKEIIEVFSIEVKPVEKYFFGVQIASFTDPTYLMRFASEIKNTYKENVIVLSKQQNERKLFTLVLGQFENRLGAENFVKKVKATYPDAFIVEIEH